MVMKARFNIKGLENISKNINKVISDTNEKSMGGMIRAAIFIRRETEKTIPKTPVDSGNLRASWFVTTRKTTQQGSNADGAVVATGKSLLQIKKIPAAMIGFTANYAAAVHEMGVSGATAGKVIKWNRRGSGAKYLETPLLENQDKIIQIIGNEIKLR